MDSLDFKSVSNPLKMFLCEYVCILQSYNARDIDMLKQLSDISNLFDTIDNNFYHIKKRFKEKEECVHKCECYLCKAVGVYTMSNFVCDGCKKKYDQEYF